MANRNEIEKMMKKLNGRRAFNACSLKGLRKLASNVLDAKETCPEDKKVFVIVSSSIDGWACHCATCSDLGRELDYANDAFVFVGTKDEMVNGILTNDIREMGFSENDVHIRPCCKKA